MDKNYLPVSCPVSRIEQTRYLSSWGLNRNVQIITYPKYNNTTRQHRHTMTTGFSVPDVVDDRRFVCPRYWTNFYPNITNMTFYKLWCAEIAIIIMWSTCAHKAVAFSQTSRCWNCANVHQCLLLKNKWSKQPNKILMKTYFLWKMCFNDSLSRFEHFCRTFLMRSNIKKLRSNNFTSL